LRSLGNKQNFSPLWATLVVVILFSGISLAEINFSQLQRLAQSRYGISGLTTVSQWHALVENNKAIPEHEKIEQVNNFFNQRIQFRDDILTWNQKDYWATPLETMGRLQGDCEDFSIAKYVTLQLMGVPIKKLRMTYVRARIGGPTSKITQAHMVLSYYPDPKSIPILLDNLVPELRPASRRPDLTPVFAFNSDGLWVGGAANPAINNPSSRLSRWRDMLSRMQQEGLQ
jgi:predicted transglutaminase-like cysteine proteinase